MRRTPTPLITITVLALVVGMAYDPVVASGLPGGQEVIASDSLLERQVIIDGIAALVNEYRESQGVRPLEPNLSLERAALEKARGLTDTGQFAHRGQVVLGIEYLANREGYRLGEYRLLGENLACGLFANPQQIVDAWVASELHRKNILEPTFSEYGIGITRGDVNRSKCENADGLVIVMAFGGTM